MKPYGDGSMSHDAGYNLPLLVSHLEGLNSGEDFQSYKGKKAERNRKVEQAIDLLNEALQIGGEL